MKLGNLKAYSDTQALLWFFLLTLSLCTYNTHSNTPASLTAASLKKGGKKTG